MKRKEKTTTTTTIRSTLSTTFPSFRYSMLFTSSSAIENSSLLDEIMLSAASTSNQHQPNFWFPGSPLPSFFSSSPSTTMNNEKMSYIQQPTTNKVLFDSSACSSSSGSSPPLSNDFLLTRSNPATTTLNLTQFNYIQQNHHHNPSVLTPTSNHFLPRDDWSQIPLAPPTTTSNTSAWHPQHPTKGKKKKSLSFFLSPHSFIASYCIREELAQYLIHKYIYIHTHSSIHSSIHSLLLNGYSMIGRMIYNICCRRITSAHS